MRAKVRELGGRTAFVTGGASGIGLALGRALAEAGMQVMLADIEPAPLAAAVESLKGIGADVRGVVCDVADPGSVDHAAKMSFDAFGKVHVVCNNAGVISSGGIENISLGDWLEGARKAKSAGLGALAFAQASEFCRSCISVERPSDVAVALAWALSGARLPSSDLPAICEPPKSSKLCE